MKIDLMPHEWKSDRVKPHEPFFGDGASGWGVWLAGFALSSIIVHLLRHS